MKNRKKKKKKSSFAQSCFKSVTGKQNDFIVEQLLASDWPVHYHSRKIT